MERFKCDLLIPPRVVPRRNTPSSDAAGGGGQKAAAAASAEQKLGDSVAACSDGYEGDACHQPHTRELCPSRSLLGGPR
jgi:hypothetical protein